MDDRDLQDLISEKSSRSMLFMERLAPQSTCLIGSSGLLGLIPSATCRMIETWERNSDEA